MSLRWMGPLSWGWLQCGWCLSLLRFAFVTGAAGTRPWCGCHSSLVRLALVTGAVGACHWRVWRSSLVMLVLVTGAVGARHWCGSRQFPVKNNTCVISSFRREAKEIRALFSSVKPQKSADIRIQQAYMHTRLTARGVLVDFLDKGDSGSSSVYH